MITIGAYNLIVHINSDYGNTIYQSLLLELNKSKKFNNQVFKFVDKNHIQKNMVSDFVTIKKTHHRFLRYIFKIKSKKVFKAFDIHYKSKKIDLIHSYTLFSNGYIAYLYYLKKSVPYIVTIRNTDINIFYRYRPHLRNLGKKILMNASKVIFLSHSMKNRFYEKYFNSKEKEVLNQKSLVIPNGVDDIFIRNVITSKKPNNKNEYKVITTAWINRNKNQLKTCKAINRLNNRGYNIKYDIIGGIEKKHDKKIAQKLDKYSFVNIIDRKSHEELIFYYRRADLFIMASKKETFGLSYIEALSQATPVIFSLNRGIDGYFNNHNFALGVNPLSIKDIKRKIKVFIDKPSFEFEFDKINFNKFQWSYIAELYNKIYESVLEQ